jgi:hypothetical protein
MVILCDVFEESISHQNFLLLSSTLLQPNLPTERVIYTPLRFYYTFFDPRTRELL